MAGESLGSSLETPWKTALLFLLAMLAVTIPSFFSRLAFIKSNEPAIMSVLIGFVVGLIMYFILRTVFTELTPRSINSTAAILGIISAHVGVYEMMDKLPSIPIYMLFLFIFYYHFDEGVELQGGVKKSQ